ncbi:MAG: DUF4255 domain-containing protein [Gilvibacter sp.]
MIDQVFDFIQKLLSQYLKNAFALDQEKIVINNIIDPDGAIPMENNNKIVLSLLNLEQETIQPFVQRNQKLADGNYVSKQPDLRFNIDILFTSNFDNYNESLKFLNAVLLFFQANPLISNTNYSNLPTGINKLEFDVEKLDYHQMHNLWSAMGAKYQPSVIYKLRLISMNAEQTLGFDPAIINTQNTITP